MPVTRSGFRPAWWLPGPHLQTLWPSFFRRRHDLPLETEVIELDDGDFLELSWHGPAGGKLVMILHGLEGSLDSHYTTGLMHSLARAGYRVALMHFRGCNKKPNRLSRSYHSGDTDDLNAVLIALQNRQLQPFAIVGFSLGGNVLLKWLGEQASQAPIARAAAISVPFLLNEAADRLDKGSSRLYQRHLLKSLKSSYQRKFSRIESPLQIDLELINNFWDFDHQVTAPLHGFDSAADYYQRSSSRQYIPAIQTPTLILHALDDPFMYPHTVPSAEEIPGAVTLELSASGGHVGFVSGWLPGRGQYWLDQRILNWLSS